MIFLPIIDIKYNFGAYTIVSLSIFIINSQKCIRHQLKNFI